MERKSHRASRAGGNRSPSPEKKEVPAPAPAPAAPSPPPPVEIDRAVLIAQNKRAQQMQQRRRTQRQTIMTPKRYAATSDSCANEKVLLLSVVAVPLRAVPCCESCAKEGAAECRCRAMLLLLLLTYFARRGDDAAHELRQVLPTVKRREGGEGQQQTLSGVAEKGMTAAAAKRAAEAEKEKAERERRTKAVRALKAKKQKEEEEELERMNAAKAKAAARHQKMKPGAGGDKPGAGRKPQKPANPPPSKHHQPHKPPRKDKAAPDQHQEQIQSPLRRGRKLNRAKEPEHPETNERDRKEKKQQHSPPPRGAKQPAATAAAASATAAAIAKAPPAIERVPAPPGPVAKNSPPRPVRKQQPQKPAEDKDKPPLTHLQKQRAAQRLQQKHQHDNKERHRSPKSRPSINGFSGGTEEVRDTQRTRTNSAPA